METYTGSTGAAILTTTIQQYRELRMTRQEVNTMFQHVDKFEKDQTASYKTTREAIA